MKKTASAKKPPHFLGVLGIILILIGILVAFFLPPTVEALIASNLSKITGLPVDIGKLHLSLTRPQFLIRDLRFSNPKGFPSTELATLGEVKVQYVPPPIILGRFDLKKVEINFKELRLVRNETGIINLPLQSPMRAVGDVVDEVVLNLGSLTYTDLSEKQPVQKTFDLGLNNAVYRNVKGVAGIMEIVNWEVLKRTGIEAKKVTPSPEPRAPAVPEKVLSTKTKTQSESSAPESSPSPTKPAKTAST